MNARAPRSARSPRWRASAAVTAMVLLLTLLAGCSGGDGAEQPAKDAGEISKSPANPAVGAYSLTTEITESTIEQNPAGPESRETNTVYVTCWDEACEELGQRATADMWHGQTFHLKPADAGGYRATRTRTGPCDTGAEAGTGSEAEYQEDFTLEWTRGEDGKLTGTAEQRFRGCEDKEVRTATYSLTATPEPDAVVPYLESGPAGELTTVLNDYDAAYTKVADDYAACFAEGAASVAVALCKRGVYESWVKAIAGLAGAVPAFAENAEGACGERLRMVRVAPALRAARAYLTGTEELEATGDAAGAEELDGTARDTALAMHERLVQAVLMCVAPQDYTSLGEDGVMLIDSAGSRIPPLG